LRRLPCAQHRRSDRPAHHEAQTSEPGRPAHRRRNPGAAMPRPGLRHGKPSAVELEAGATSAPCTGHCLRGLFYAAADARAFHRSKRLSASRCCCCGADAFPAPAMTSSSQHRRPRWGIAAFDHAAVPSDGSTFTDDAPNQIQVLEHRPAANRPASATAAADSGARGIERRKDSASGSAWCPGARRRATSTWRAHRMGPGPGVSTRAGSQRRGNGTFGVNGSGYSVS